ncbi:hypothetical protein GF322_04760 [Candidatus Dependentiae bacterium]|nr:hypothetical protein [Candidatus Dependentiae bacterium]
MKKKQLLYFLILTTFFLNINTLVANPNTTVDDEVKTKEETARKIQTFFRKYLTKKNQFSSDCPICRDQYDSENKNLVILLCCNKQVCEECMKNVGSLGCPFCRQIPIKYKRVKDNEVINLPFILKFTNLIIMDPNKFLPLDIYFSPEDIKQIVENTRNCDEIKPWNACLLKQQINNF